MGFELIPCPWVAIEDPKSGKTYYANRETRKTSWKVPPDFVPAPWVKGKDSDTGKVYYVNKETRETSWEPEEVKKIVMDIFDSNREKCMTERKKLLRKNRLCPKRTKKDNVLSVFTKPGQMDKEQRQKDREFAKKKELEDFKRKQQEKLDEKARLQKEREEWEAEQKRLEEEEKIAKQKRKEKKKKLKLEQKRRQKEEEKKKAELEEERKNALPPMPLLENAKISTQAFSMMKFAEQNFILKSGLLGGTQKAEDLLKFTTKLRKKALLKCVPDKRASDAIQFSKNIISFMGDRESSKKPFDHATKLLKMARILPQELMDEVFCLIVRQLIDNPKQQSVVMGWQLMALTLLTFPPGEELAPFLAKFLFDHHSKDGDVGTLAKYSSIQLDAVAQAGVSSSIPGPEEINTITRMAQENVAEFERKSEALKKKQEALDAIRKENERKEREEEEAAEQLRQEEKKKKR